MPRITILGWKRDRMPELLKLCEELAFELAKMNFAVVTGGGGGFMEAGKHSVKFNAKDFTSGVYFYTIKADNFTSTRKMMLMK